MAGCARFGTIQTNVTQWKVYGTDANAGYASPGRAPSGKYGWLCIGGVWVECYRAGVVNNAPTNPSYIDQDPRANTHGEIVGIPLQEKWDGIKNSSKVAGPTDKYYPIRWDQGYESGAVSIVSNKLHIDMSGAAGSTVRIICSGLNLTGDYDITIDYDWDADTSDESNDRAVFINLRTSSGTNAIYNYKYGGGDHVFTGRVADTYGSEPVISNYSGSFHIYRSGSTVYCEDGGHSETYSGTNAANPYQLELVNYDARSTRSMTANWGDVITDDGVKTPAGFGC